MSSLQNCPKCGEKPNMGRYPVANWVYAVFIWCESKCFPPLKNKNNPDGSDMFYRREEAISAWNDRCDEYKNRKNKNK